MAENKNLDYLTVADRHALLRLAISELGPRRDRLKVRRDKEELAFKNSVRAKYAKQNSKLASICAQIEKLRKEEHELENWLRGEGVYPNDGRELSVNSEEWKQKWDKENLLDPRDIQRRILLCESRAEIKALIENMEGK